MCPAVYNLVNVWNCRAVFNSDLYTLQTLSVTEISSDFVWWFGFWLMATVIAMQGYVAGADPSLYISQEAEKTLDKGTGPSQFSSTKANINPHIPAIYTVGAISSFQ